MAQLTITVNDALVPLFQAARARWNQENGKNLNAENWIKYLVALEVFRDDIRDEEANQRIAADNALRAAVQAAKESKIGTL